MDLTQFPPSPIGSRDDPLADTFDDPSYSFTYRTEDQSRTEDNDQNGYLKGLYSFVDDAGERHNVRYAAGAGTGFEVSNAVPDNPTNVAYAAPLFKSHPRTRGKMSVQRGPLGSYKLIAAGPDHRRAESRNTDGFVRGTYSFLDDKGIQRTVEYIAGAGIGYRVLQNRVGPGTHINPSISNFQLSDKDFRVASDFRKSTVVNGIIDEKSASSSFGLNDRKSSAPDYSTASSSSSNIDRFKSRSGSNIFRESGSIHRKDDDNISTNGAGENKDATNSDNASHRSMHHNIENASVNFINRENTRIYGRADGTSSSNGRIKTEDKASFDGNSFSSVMNTRIGLRNRITGLSPNLGNSFATSRSGTIGNQNKSLTTTNYNFNDEDVSALPPLITANREILDLHRERDWVNKHYDSTVIKNVGKWYIGLPPGQSVRAHVQNIDLLPLGGRRILSPSEAYRAEEKGAHMTSIENAVVHN